MRIPLRLCVGLWKTTKCLGWEISYLMTTFLKIKIWGHAPRMCDPLIAMVPLPWHLPLLPYKRSQIWYWIFGERKTPLPSGGIQCGVWTSRHNPHKGKSFDRSLICLQAPTKEKNDLTNTDAGQHQKCSQNWKYLSNPFNTKRDFRRVDFLASDFFNLMLEEILRTAELNRDVCRWHLCRRPTDTPLVLPSSSLTKS